MATGMPVMPHAHALPSHTQCVPSRVVHQPRSELRLPVMLLRGVDSSMKFSLGCLSMRPLRLLRGFCSCPGAWPSSCMPCSMSHLWPRC